MTNDKSNGAAPKKSSALVRLEAFQNVLSEDFVKNQLQNALGEASSSFAASLIEIVTSDQYLQECEPKKVVLQAMKAAALHLPLSKQLGYAWIIAYNKEPTFQIGYKGLIQLAIRSGQYRTMNTDAVYEGEFRRLNRLTGEFDFSGEKTSDKIVGYFAYFELKNGFQKTLYMTEAQVRAHAERYSKSYKNPRTPWSTNFPEMAKKTTVRLLLTHWGYLSVDMVEAIKADTDYDAAEDVMAEIKERGNAKTAGFTEAETVTEPPTEKPQPQDGPGW